MAASTNPAKTGAKPESPILVYIAKQPTDVQPVLRRVYDVLHAVLPDAEEQISWGMPTWRGRVNIIHFAAQKHHVGVYPGAEAIEHFAPLFDARGYRHSKGAVQFPYDRVDFALIETIARWCAERHREEDNR